MPIYYKNQKSKSEKKQNQDIALEYIHGHEEKVPWNIIYPIFDANTKKNEQMMLQKYAKDLRNKIKISSNNNQVNLLEQLFELDDNFLVEIMDNFASSANEQINKKYNESISQITDLYGQLLTQSNLLSKVSNKLVKNGQLNTQAKTFFENLKQLLDIVNNIPQKEWDDFVLYWCTAVDAIKTGANTKFGRTMNKLLNSDGTVVSLDPSLKSANQVQQYLINIINTMKSTGSKTFSEKQMKDSLGKIMGEVAGEFFSIVEQNFLIDIDNMVMDSVGKQASNKNSFNKKSKQSFKTSIIAPNNAFDLSIGLQNYTITGELNSSIKWYQDKKVNSSKNISISNKMKLMDGVRDLYGYGNLQLYGVFNTLAFYNRSGEGEVAYQLLRKNILSSFLGDMLSQKDKNIQLLIVNGYIYPVISIINEYIKHAQNGSNTTINLTFRNLSKIDNTMIDPERMSKEKAMVRNEIVKKQINQIMIDAAINNKTLARLATKLKVNPI